MAVAPVVRWYKHPPLAPGEQQESPQSVRTCWMRVVALGTRGSRPEAPRRWSGRGPGSSLRGSSPMAKALSAPCSTHSASAMSLAPTPTARTRIPVRRKSWASAAGRSRGSEQSSSDSVALPGWTTSSAIESRTTEPANDARLGSTSKAGASVPATVSPMPSTRDLTAAAAGPGIPVKGERCPRRARRLRTPSTQLVGCARSIESLKRQGWRPP